MGGHRGGWGGTPQTNRGIVGNRKMGEDFRQNGRDVLYCAHSSTRQTNGKLVGEPCCLEMILNEATGLKLFPFLKNGKKTQEANAGGKVRILGITPNLRTWWGLWGGKVKTSLHSYNNTPGMPAKQRVSCIEPQTLTIAAGGESNWSPTSGLWAEVSSKTPFQLLSERANKRQAP